MSDDLPRITDLSSLDPENFKFRNTDFLMGETHYEILPYQDRKHKIRREIPPVRLDTLYERDERYEL